MSIPSVTGVLEDSCANPPTEDEEGETDMDEDAELLVERVLLGVFLCDLGVVMGDLPCDLNVVVDDVLLELCRGGAGLGGLSSDLRGRLDVGGRDGFLDVCHGVRCRESRPGRRLGEHERYEDRRGAKDCLKKRADMNVDEYISNGRKIPYGPINLTGSA
jgi:hypothetical protein